MTQHSDQALKNEPQPGDLNPQVEKDMLGKDGGQRELGIDPDAILAAMVANVLSPDRVRGKEFTGVVLHHIPAITELTPEMGPFYKVYKELEKQELEKDPEGGTANVVAKADKALFMIKVRVPILDSMIPPPPLYNINNQLGEKVFGAGGAESLTDEEKLSIKYISMHTTFVGKKGGFMGFGEELPPVGSYVRVSYDDVKNFSGPQYLGQIEIKKPEPSGGGGFFGMPSWGDGSCNGGLGNHPVVQGVKTASKNLVKSIFGKDEKKQIQEEIDKIKAEMIEIDDSPRPDQEMLATLGAKKRGLEAKLRAKTPPASSADPGAGDRRQDPTVPPASPPSSCAASSTVGGRPPGPFVPGQAMHDGIVRDIKGCIDPATPSPNADKLRAVLKELGYYEKGREISNGGDLLPEGAVMMASILRSIKLDHPDIRITLTGGNDCFHQERIRRKGSGVTRHGSGRAMDMAVYPVTADTLDRVCQSLMNYAAANDRNCRFIDEYRRPSGHATGGHFHFSWGTIDNEGQWWMEKAEKLSQSSTPWSGGTARRSAGKSLAITATTVNPKALKEGGAGWFG